MSQEIASAIDHVRQRIDRSCERAGRDPGSVQLVAVSKGHPEEVIRAAYDAGMRVFGENYAQELAAKALALSDLRDTQQNQAHRGGAGDCGHGRFSEASAGAFHASGGKRDRTRGAPPGQRGRRSAEVRLHARRSPGARRSRARPAEHQLTRADDCRASPRRGRSHPAILRHAPRVGGSTRLAGAFHGDDPRPRTSGRRRRNDASNRNGDLWAAPVGRTVGSESFLSWRDAN